MNVQKMLLNFVIYWLHKDANENSKTLMNPNKHIHDCQIQY